MADADAREMARDLVRRLTDAYNTKDLKGVAALYRDDARYWSPLFGWIEGRSEIQQHIADLFELLPDEQMTIRALVTDGEVAVVEFQSSGRSSTNKKYSIDFTEVIELRDRRIASVRVYLDPEEVKEATP